MGDETTPTPAEIEAANRKKAREINEERNRSRMDRLSEIADNNEAMRAGDMVETPDGNLNHKAEDDAAAKEAAAQAESVEAERALAELQAKTLQEEGAEGEAAVEEPGETHEEVEAKDEPKDTGPADTKVVNGETYYLTVVNGNEKWLTLTQLRTTAQKVESADQYLAAAAESVRNAARLDLSKKTDEPSKIEEVDLEKTLSSAVMGDQEAIKKLASVFRGFQSQAKPSEVTPDVLQQIDERWSFRRAAEWFEDEYADLLGDPFLKKLVYERDAELANSAPKMPYKKRLKEAGDEIRGWINKKAAPPPTGVKATSSDTKADRKKTLVNVPSAAARQTPPVDEEEAETVEDVIQKMAKARGQARAMVHRPTNRIS
jgi:hypothetical protein